MQSYIDAIGRATQRQRLDDLFDNRAAQYDQKGFKEYVRELKR